MLTIEKVKQHYDVHELETPAMIVDNSVISQKFVEFRGMIDGVRVFYSVKANPHKVVLTHIRDLGSGFEISSTKELRAVASLGVSPDLIVVGNTMKVPSFIEQCHEYGVNYFAYDSQTEVDKLADLAPGSNVALRISVDNSGSEWPLSARFGVSCSEAVQLLAYAKKKRLNPYGLTFHVGSQCIDATAWSKALVTVAQLLKWASDNDLNIEVVNLGGGYPCTLHKDIPSLTTIKQSINESIARDFAHDGSVKFYIEPGRGLVGDSALIVSRIIGKAERGPERWIVLDVGVYNGLLECCGGIRYRIVTDKELSIQGSEPKKVLYRIAGPTCDSWDLMSDGYQLPEDLEVGDILYILNTGAYTLSLSTNFNGFDFPELHFLP